MTMTDTIPQARERAASVSVRCWGELPGERKLPGVLRVLVDGQHAGAVEYRAGGWAAYWHTAAYGRGLSSDRASEHATAEDAVRAVIRSGWAPPARRPGRLARPLVRGGPPGRGPPRRCVMTAGRAIRWSAVAAVAGVAVIAGWVSYLHAYGVVSAHGEAGLTGRLYPGTIDGLIFCASMALLDAARRGVPQRESVAVGPPGVTLKAHLQPAVPAARVFVRIPMPQAGNARGPAIGAGSLYRVLPFQGVTQDAAQQHPLRIVCRREFRPGGCGGRHRLSRAGWGGHRASSARYSASSSGLPPFSVRPWPVPAPRGPRKPA